MKYIKNFGFIGQLILILVIGIFLAPSAVFAVHIWTISEINTAVDQFIYNETDADGSNIIVAFPTFNAVGGRIFTSSDSGISWTERQPAGATTKNWRAIASDSDGSNLIAGVMNGRLYTSSNSGANWTERRPAGDFDHPWQTVASDADGSTLIATTSWGNVYISTNSGSSWTTRQPSGDIADWILSAVSDDGSFMIAGAYDGRIYTSSNSGAAWTERQPAGNIAKSWQSVAMDSDGSTIVLGVDGGRLYSSSDFGANWIERQPVGAADQDWQDVAVSDDGSYVVAAVYGGRVYISSDGGSNWSEVQPAGDTTQYWISVSTDSDASHIVLTKNQIFSGLPAVQVYMGVVDTFSPLLASSFPADGSTGASLDANLIMAFNESVKANTGNVAIKKANGTLVETIDVTSDQIIGFGTNTLTVNPTNNLDYGTSYYVTIDPMAFEDDSGNGYAGIYDKKSWAFKTVAAPKGGGKGGGNKR